MAVTVRLIGGDEKTFRDADSAARLDTMIVVSKWNTTRRHLDEVAVCFQRTESSLQRSRRTASSRTAPLETGRLNQADQSCSMVVKKKPHVDDADVDRFVAMFAGKSNPALTPELRADFIHDFVLGYSQMTEADVTPEWTRELARRVRQRALWLKPSN